ncbi:MAG: hypothetical protein QM779_17270 [Propionicimonas sp.]|uniref:prenyltransferase/squalene oxidase repeat-containing protein n=1 Tax=Propionicimonas sp. TaxID=1955623 RepID=UPI003D0CECE6
MYSPIKRWLAVGTAAVVASIGLGPSSTAAAAELSTSATKAAAYLTSHLPTSKSSFDSVFQTTLGLAATGKCTYATSLRTLEDTLTTLAPKYVKSGGAVAAAKVALAAESIGADPEAFAGTNLITTITADLPSSGQVGSSANGFGQALAIIALSRNGTDVPASMVTNLLAYQGTDGGFAWLASGDPDPDTTAVAILALNAAGGHADEVADAVDWADNAQLADGSWAASYDGTELSPVDSTGLLGSALSEVGADTGDALSWLTAQQLSSGAFSNVRSGTKANLMSTSEALYLLTGHSLASALVDLNACPWPLPASTTSCTGVWVVVYRAADDYSVRCAAKYATGFEALASAGFTAGLSSGFLNRVNGFPEVIDTTWTNWWGYYHATPNSDGTWGDWTAYDVGGDQSTPVTGEAELWNYGPNTWGETPDAPYPPLGYATVVTPKVKGTVKVGHKLTAVRGSWLPKPDSYSYRWYNDGKAISGATSRTYKLKKSDKGDRISVKVTAKGKGLQTVSVMSAKTAKVRK